MENNMFCFQCQETAKGFGCTLKGVCGKNATTARTMYLLLFVNAFCNAFVIEIGIGNGTE